MDDVISNVCRPRSPAYKCVLVFTTFVLVICLMLTYATYRVGRRKADLQQYRKVMDNMRSYCPRRKPTRECGRWNAPELRVRGELYVLHNCFTPTRRSRCNRSVTLATHADLGALAELAPLVERWNGPVSLAVYASGSDFGLALSAIHRARECLTPLIAEHVTFHLYYDRVPAGTGWKVTTNCAEGAPARTRSLYPANVGRNIAREASLTHFVFVVDIEVRPSPGVMEDFLAMVRRGGVPTGTTNPKVFVLPIFQLANWMAVPRNKTELVAMLKNGTAVTFHEVPNEKAWVDAKETSGLSVFHVGKRVQKFSRWEPVYIGTNDDPWYDEGGAADTTPQAFAMCLLDYDFLILDNAFLVRKPGVQPLSTDPRRIKAEALIQNKIKPHLIAKYGDREGCDI